MTLNMADKDFDLEMSNIQNKMGDLSINYNTLSKNGDTDNTLPSEENENIFGEKHLPDKMLYMENDLQKILCEKLETLLVDEKTLVQQEKICDATKSSQEKPMKTVCNADQHVLRKRGPDKITFHAVNHSSPYAKTDSHSNLQSSWITKPRNSFFEGYPQSDISLNDTISDLKEKQEIRKIVSYLSDTPDANKIYSYPDYFEHQNFSDFKMTQEELFESLLTDTPTTLNSVTPPINVPDNVFQIALEQNYSPQSSTSTDDGYLSENYRSQSSSPVQNYNLPLPVSHCSTPGNLLVISSYGNAANVNCIASTQAPTVPKENTSDTFKKVPAKKRNEFLEGQSEKLVDKCRREILKRCREEGLNQKDGHQRTLLHIAIEKGNEVYALVFIGMIEKCFQNGTKKGGLEYFPDLQSFLNQQDSFGRTPLLLACSSNMSKVVSHLLKCRVDLTVNGESVLHYVCTRGERFFDVAKVLCECTYSKQCIKMKNKDGETPLHVAVSNHGLSHKDEFANISEKINNTGIISLLLGNGADLSAQDKFGHTAIHKIIITKRVELLTCLHLSTFTADWIKAVNVKDFEGMTVLHWAVCCQGLKPNIHKKLIECLIAMNATPGIRDGKGKLAMDYIPDGRADLTNALDPGYYQFDMKTGVIM